jgi:hypothetical protein
MWVGVAGWLSWVVVGVVGFYNRNSRFNRTRKNIMSKSETRKFTGANVNPDDLKPKEQPPSYLDPENDSVGAYLQWQQEQFDLLGIPGFTTEVPANNPQLVVSLQWLRDRGVPEAARVRNKVEWPGKGGYGFETTLLVWDVTAEGERLMEPFRAAEYLVAINPKVVFNELIEKGVLPKGTQPVY